MKEEDIDRIGLILCGLLVFGVLLFGSVFAKADTPWPDEAIFCMKIATIATDLGYDPNVELRNRRLDWFEQAFPSYNKHLRAATRAAVSMKKDGYNKEHVRQGLYHYCRIEVNGV